MQLDISRRKNETASSPHHERVCYWNNSKYGASGVRVSVPLLPWNFVKLQDDLLTGATTIE